MFENKYKIMGEYTILYLNKKDGPPQECFIDTEDLERLIAANMTWGSKWSWSTEKDYVVASQYLGFINGKGFGRPVYLSRFLMNAPSKTHVDHADFDTMNNRKYNLRVATVSNNIKNRSKVNKNNKSGHRNIYLNKAGWYRIQLQINGKNHMFSEKFRNIEDAVVFAKQMREKYYGEYAGKDI
jgi:hypothetical protein